MSKSVSSWSFCFLSFFFVSISIQLCSASSSSTVLKLVDVETSLLPEQTRSQLYQHWAAWVGIIPEQEAIKMGITSTRDQYLQLNSQLAQHHSSNAAFYGEEEPINSEQFIEHGFVIDKHVDDKTRHNDNHNSNNNNNNNRTKLRYYPFQLPSPTELYSRQIISLHQTYHQNNKDNNHADDGDDDDEHNVYQYGVLLSETNVTAQCRRDAGAYANSKIEGYSTYMIHSAHYFNREGIWTSCNQQEGARYSMFSAILYTFNPANPFIQVAAGLCVPNTCTDLEVATLAKSFLPKEVAGAADLFVPGTAMAHGYQDDDDFWEYHDCKIMIIVISIFLALVAFGTFFEYKELPPSWTAFLYASSPSSSSLADDYDFVGTSGNNKLDDSLLPTSSPSDEKDRGSLNDNHSNHNNNNNNNNNHHNNSPTSHSTFFNVITDWSLMKNTKALAKPQPVSAHTDLSSVNGFRTLSMCWVILGHTVVLVDTFYYDVDYIFGTVAENFWMTLILNAYVAVDSFFVIAGLLGTWLVLEGLRKAKKNQLSILEWSMAILHRYLRLTPVYLFWILMYMFFTPYIGSGHGPFWYQYQEFSTSGDSVCHKHWWTNIIYINNFYPEDFNEQCFGWGWFLANVFQYFLILPFFIALYQSRKSLGWILLIVTCLGGAISSTVLSFQGHFSAGVLGTGHEVGNYQNQVYGKPYTRWPAFAAGIGLAYCLDAVRTQHMPRVLRLGYGLTHVITLTATTLMVLPVFAPWDINKHHPEMPQFQSSYDWNRTANAIYLGFHSLSWSIGLCWLIFLFSRPGRGGFIRSFLSHRAWLPLSRLTYEAYLVHPIILFAKTYVGGKLRYSNIEYTYQFLGLCVMSYLLAFAGWLLVEKPLMNWESRFFKWIMPKNKKTSSSSSSSSSSISSSLLSSSSTSPIHRPSNLDGNHHFDGAKFYRMKDPLSEEYS